MDISTSPATQRVYGRPFVKGGPNPGYRKRHSGNPAGRRRMQQAADELYARVLPVFPAPLDALADALLRNGSLSGEQILNSRPDSVCRYGPMRATLAEIRLL
jgi:hypothetical protein